MKTIEMGKEYEDRISGIKGTATAITEYLTGCSRVCLEFVNNGEIKEYWFDITRLADVKLQAKDKKPGGPGPTPPARTPPSR